MACQASARVARGWINSSGRLHGDRALVKDGRGKLLSFWSFLCFIFSTITADGCMGACTGPVFATNTIPSAPGKERVKRDFLREAVWWAVGPWRDSTLSSSCPADQEAGAGSEAQGPMLSSVGGPGTSERGGVWLSMNALTSAESWQAEGRETGRCRLRRLLSRRSLGATLSSCWAGALGQEVSHSLWRLLCLCEVLSESFHRRSKEAAGGNWSIKDGDLVHVLNLRQREPQVALEHPQAGHRPSYGLGGGLGGSQSQVCCTSQLPESRRIRLRLVYGREELGLIYL